jgi:acetyl-CoA C-acetyltransferase
VQALIYAYLQVSTGGSDVVIAGGAESMSNAPFFTHRARWGIQGPALELHDSLARGRVTAGGVHYPVTGGMLETAENLRREYGISREEQDMFAVESQRRAIAAQQQGLFDDEIIPVTVPGRKGNTVVTEDETGWPEGDQGRCRPGIHSDRGQRQYPERWCIRLYRGE